MKKSYTKFAFAFFSAFCICLLTTQCKYKDLDLTKPIDPKVSIGGDSLMFPIGTTDTLRLNSFLKMDSIGMLVVLADGSFAFVMSDSISLELPVISADQMQMPDIEGGSIIGLPVNNIDGLPADWENLSNDIILPPLNFDLQVDSVITIEFENPHTPSEIHSLDSLVLGQATVFSILVSLDQNISGNIAKDFYTNMEIQLPKNIRYGNISIPDVSFNTNTNKLIFLNKKLGVNGLKIDIPMKTFIFDGLPIHNSFDVVCELSYKGSLKADNVSLNVGDAKTIMAKKADMQMKASITQIEISQIYGIISPSIPEQKLGISLDMIPDFLKKEGLVFDFYNPYIKMKNSSNAGVPVKGDIRIRPFVGATVNPEAAVEFSILLPQSPNPLVFVEKGYWIADYPNNPAPEPGYEYMQKNISKIFERMPDSIQFDIIAYADTSVKHHIYVGVPYKVKVNYNVTVPFSFGENFNISLSDTMQNLSGIFNTGLQGTEFAIYGEITNSIPLDLELSLVPLDQDMKPLPVKVSKAIIKAGNADGTAFVSKLELSIDDKETHLLGNVHALMLYFEAKTGENTVGVTVKESNYVLARLKARLLGGITMEF